MKTLGQYFTKSTLLQEKVKSFIMNKPLVILEPSVGRGDLVDYSVCVNYDLFEIDPTINFLPHIQNVVISDFLTTNIDKKYDTIIGNPPYVKTTKGNLYIDFISKCVDLLADNGELVFVIPSDFFKLTMSVKLMDKMLNIGSFTHIFHPNNEKLFENANIDVLIFRYQKTILTNLIRYNDENKILINSNGLITFSNTIDTHKRLISDYFTVYVGMVSACEKVFKSELGSKTVLNKENKREKYIIVDKFPTDDSKINDHLINHKKELIERKIRKFSEENWFEWGALRNKKIVGETIGSECLYINTLTRAKKVAFIGNVELFGGGLLMLLPKQNIDLTLIVDYLNSDEFKQNFIFSGRFKIGHRQMCNSYF